MRKDHKKLMLTIIACVFLFVSVMTGCSSQEPEARKTLDDYLSCIQGNDCANAYGLISDFDKKHISESTFCQWRSVVDRIAEKESFEIDEKTDKLGAYEYMGTQFKSAYGFSVKWEQTYLVSGIETKDYDQDEFMIMVVEENNEFKIALLILDLDANIEKYMALLEKQA